MTALIVVPDPGFTQRVEVGHDILVALGDVEILSRAKMPDFRARAGANINIGKRVQGSANVFEIRISRDVQLRNITRFEADALNRGQVGDDDACEVCAMETFDGFK